MSALKDLDDIRKKLFFQDLEAKNIIIEFVDSHKAQPWYPRTDDERFELTIDELPYDFIKDIVNYYIGFGRANYQPNTTRVQYISKKEVYQAYRDKYGGG